MCLIGGQRSRVSQQNKWLRLQMQDMHSEAVTAREQFAKQLLDLVATFSEEQLRKMEDTTSSLSHANDKAMLAITESTKQLDAGFEAAQADRTRIHQFIESGLLDAEQRQTDNEEVRFRKRKKLCSYVC